MNKNKFTLIELLIVVAIIGILASILLPSLHRTRVKAKIAVCASNLKQINLMYNYYIDDNDETFPQYGNYHVIDIADPTPMTDYMEDSWGLVLCPGDEGDPNGNGPTFDNAVGRNGTSYYPAGFHNTFGVAFVYGNNPRNVNDFEQPTQKLLTGDLQWVRNRNWRNMLWHGVNKEAGMVVHPGAGIHGGTLVNALLGYDEKVFRKMDDQRPGIVHRIDKETSGVLIIAKNPKAKEKLVKKFANRQVDKFYLALVRGHIRMGRGMLETWIGRSKDNRLKMKSYEEDDGEGKHALTHYKVLAENKGVSLVKVKIETGRTHQIRVHMSEMGFPVIGDKIYGKKRLEMSTSPGRHILHAWRLKLDHPISGQPMVFTAPLPESFTQILDKFGIDIKS